MSQSALSSEPRIGTLGVRVSFGWYEIKGGYRELDISARSDYRKRTERRLLALTVGGAAGDVMRRRLQRTR